MNIDDLRGGVTRSIYPHAYLFPIAERCMEQASSAGTLNSLDQHSYMIASMAFCAFSIEAYLNHVGSTKFGAWDIVERQLTPQKKLEFLLKTYQLSVDFGRRPFQTLDEILKFRNNIVHAKPSVTEASMSNAAMGQLPIISYYTQLNCERAVAQRFLADTEAMMMELHRMFDFQADTLFEAEKLQFGPKTRTPEAGEKA